MNPAPPPTNLAGEPIDPTQDLVGVAVRGIAVAVLLGAAMEALVLWGVIALVGDAPAPDGAPVATGPAPLLLLTGTVAAMLLAAAIAWRRLAPIESYYRRGVLATVCAFATFVSGLIAAPVHYAAGSAGLLAMAAVAALAGGLIARRSRRR